MDASFTELKRKIESCRFCEQKFGFVPHPVFWGNENAKIVQISQAPSSAVHDSMKTFTDMSGKTLKYEWYNISDEIFYNKDNFYIGAMAHCYPGKNKNGNDKVPPKCCFTKFWVTSLSDSAVLIPSEIMGRSETNRSAPVGMRLEKPTVKIVAVSISMAIALVFTRYSLKWSSYSHTRRLVV